MIQLLLSMYMSIANKYSKYVGVTFDKRRSKWISVIKLRGKTKFLGYFNTELEAFNKRQQFENENEDILYRTILKNYKDAVSSDYISGKSLQELAIKYNKDVTTIRDIIIDRGIIRPRKLLFSEELGNNLVNEYVDGKSILKMSEETDISVSSLINLLKKNNIKCRNSRKFLLKDENFLRNLDMPWKAYFLGLFYADGNMRKLKDSSYNCSITLAEQDGDILHKLYDHIYISDDVLKNKMLRPVDKRAPINKKTGLPSNAQRAVRLVVNSKELYQSLELMGCTAKKSLTLTFPIIPKELLKDFVRGYLDGDGWVVDKTSVGLISSRAFCDQYSFIMENIVGEPAKIYNAGKVWRAVFHKKRIFKHIYNWIYDECGDLFILRKYNRFSERISRIP